MPRLPSRWRPWHLFDRRRFAAQPAPLLALLEALRAMNLQPQPAHQLIASLSNRGALVRCYTQNIDSLEAMAGTPEDRIVYVHGHLPTEVPAEVPFTAADAGAAIAFIGDTVSLPTLVDDLARASVLLVLGTSFTAATAADIAADCSVPRVLVTLPGAPDTLPPRRTRNGTPDGIASDHIVREDVQTFAAAALTRLGTDGLAAAAASEEHKAAVPAEGRSGTGGLLLQVATDSHPEHSNKNTGTVHIKSTL